jgi:nitroreductase
MHIGTKNREHLAPWKVREGEFPKHGNLTEQIEYLLQYAILAPSNHNSQPWLFRLRPDGVDLLADRTRQLSVADSGTVI